MTATIIDNTEIIKEKVYAIVPIFDKADKKTEYKCSEIAALIESSGGIYIGCNSPFIREITPATVIGSGKVKEIKEILDNLKADLVVYDGDLSPSQTLNLAKELDVKVIDRSTLILDIFAQRAKTPEGKLQVELAQLKYIYPRLKGKGSGLSQQGGGIGTRGPGETQLESDRRHIRLRIKYLEKNLAELTVRRSLQSDRRKKNNYKCVALVGYTNVGKSTLMNALADAEVYTENKLFATLDPSFKRLQLKDIEVILVDTVGFISDLPTDLIEAFKSTLESAVNADLILNVLDITADYGLQEKITLDILSQLKCTADIITVYNKCDEIEDLGETDRNAVYISAKNGKGLEKLKSKINEYFTKDYILTTLNIPFTDLNLYNKYITSFKIISEEYQDSGLKVQAMLPKELFGKFEKFSV